MLTVLILPALVPSRRVLGADGARVVASWGRMPVESSRPRAGWGPSRRVLGPDAGRVVASWERKWRESSRPRPRARGIAGIRGPDASVAVRDELLAADSRRLLLVAHALPGRTLHKRRHLVVPNDSRLVVDEYDDGTLVTEIDDGAEPSDLIPDWLDVVRDVTCDDA